MSWYVVCYCFFMSSCKQQLQFTATKPEINFQQSNQGSFGPYFVKLTCTRLHIIPKNSRVSIRIVLLEKKWTLMLDSSKAAGLIDQMCRKLSNAISFRENAHSEGKPCYMGILMLRKYWVAILSIVRKCCHRYGHNITTK